MKLKLLGGFAAVIALAASCINVNERLGEDLIPDNQNYTFYTTTLDIDDMRMEKIVLFPLKVVVFLNVQI